jgi:cytochrome oxidase Cu insertion factor (SCO1/SenC/PrrC family)
VVAVFTVVACLALVPGKLAAADLEDLLWDLQIVPLDGQTPPDFTLGSLAGKKVSLRAFRGKPVLLYFWATW